MTYPLVIQMSAHRYIAFHFLSSKMCTTDSLYIKYDKIFVITNCRILLPSKVFYGDLYPLFNQRFQSSIIQVGIQRLCDFEFFKGILEVTRRCNPKIATYVPDLICHPSHLDRDHQTLLNGDWIFEAHLEEDTWVRSNFHKAPVPYHLLEVVA